MKTSPRNLKTIQRGAETASSTYAKLEMPGRKAVGSPGDKLGRHGAGKVRGSGPRNSKEDAAKCWAVNHKEREGPETGEQCISMATMLQSPQVGFTEECSVRMLTEMQELAFPV